jgi:hypothetical protein
MLRGKPKFGEGCSSHFTIWDKQSFKLKCPHGRFSPLPDDCSLFQSFTEKRARARARARA